MKMYPDSTKRQSGRANLSIFGIVLIASLLLGCGFHLRTWDLAVSVERASVVSDAAPALGRTLSKSLRQSGVEIVSVDDNPRVVVEIISESLVRRSVSVTGQARVAEYAMTLNATVRISQGDQVLADRRSFRSERTYRLDRDNIVGSSEEQALLERELRADVVQQIFRTLNAVI